MSEAPPIIMQRRGTFLVPMAPIDGEALAKFSPGKPLRVRVTQARSLPQMRLYWSMLNLVSENLDQPVTPETLHEWLKLKLGVSHPIKLKSGEVVHVPGSIAFDKMSQSDFAVYFQAAAEMIVEHIIPGMSRPALEREAQLMLGVAA